MPPHAMSQDLVGEIREGTRAWGSASSPTLGSTRSIFVGTERPSDNVFSGWGSTGRSSSHSPDGWVHTDGPWSIHKGVNNRRMYMARDNPTTGSWTTWYELEGETDDRPGLAGFKGDLLAIHRGLDNQICVKNITRNVGWKSEGRSTSAPPSMVEFGAGSLSSTGSPS